MTPILFAPEALEELFDAIEEVLSGEWTYPEPRNGSEPACLIPPDALLALEDAYERLVDRIIDAAAAEEGAA